MDILWCLWYIWDMVTIMDIRDQVRTDILDYQQLVASLHEYAKPRDRISALLAVHVLCTPC